MRGCLSPVLVLVCVFVFQIFVFGVSVKLTDERARATNIHIMSSTSPVDDRAVGPRARSSLHRYACAETVFCRQKLSRADAED